MIPDFGSLFRPGYYGLMGQAWVSPVDDAWPPHRLRGTSGKLLFYITSGRVTSRAVIVFLLRIVSLRQAIIATVSPQRVLYYITAVQGARVAAPTPPPFPAPTGALSSSVSYAFFFLRFLVSFLLLRSRSSCMCTVEGWRGSLRSSLGTSTRDSCRMGSCSD